MTAPFDPARLRILNYNTHVGVTIRGALRFLLDTHDPHLVVLQEVQSPRARLAARVVLPPHIWSAVGTRPASTGRGSAGTLLFARRSALELAGSSNELVTPFRDRFHPERRCTTGRYVHRATGQVLDIGAVHLWTLAGSAAAPAIRAAHLTQLRAHAGSARRARSAGRLPFRIGDFNEHISGGGGSPAERELATADLRPARPAGDHTGRLDEIFVPREIACHDYRAITLPSHFPGVEGPHKALVVDVTIPPRSHPARPVHAGHRAGRG
jgi:hypothetical protein